MLQSSHANVYADDEAITIASSTVVKMTEGARKELANIAEWVRVNKLRHPLSTRKPKLPETFELNGSEIKRLEKNQISRNYH